MTTICSKCGRELNEVSGEKWLLCKYCNWRILININSYKNKNKNLKGGKNEMVENKKVKNEKNLKKVKIKQTSITELRIENVKKLRDYMSNDLKLNLSEQRKVMSRCYNTIAKEQKSKK